MKNIHVYPSYLEHESRIEKITNSLEKNNVFDQIAIVGIWKQNLIQKESLSPMITIYRVKNYLFFLPYHLRKIFDLISLNIFILFKFRKFDVINCHNLNSLFIGVIMKRAFKLKLIYDTHELETERNGLNGFIKLISKIIEKSLITHIDGIVLVSNTIKKKYKEIYPKLTINNVVLYNFPNNEENTIKLNSEYLRGKFKFLAHTKTFIYSGLLSEERGISELLDLFKTLKDNIVFIGFGPLALKIKTYSKQNKNIFFHDPVKKDILIQILKQADIGIYTPFNIKSLNNKLAMPNKLFEFIQSGIPVIVSKDFIDITRIINENNIGWTVTDKNDLFKLLIAIDKNEIENKKQCLRLCSNKFIWENQEHNLIDFYKKII